MKKAPAACPNCRNLECWHSLHDDPSEQIAPFDKDPHHLSLISDLCPPIGLIIFVITLIRGFLYWIKDLGRQFRNRGIRLTYKCDKCGFIHCYKPD